MFWGIEAGRWNTPLFDSVPLPASPDELTLCHSQGELAPYKKEKLLSIFVWIFHAELRFDCLSAMGAAVCCYMEEWNGKKKL